MNYWLHYFAVPGQHFKAGSIGVGFYYFGNDVLDFIVGPVLVLGGGHPPVEGGVAGSAGRE